MVSALCCIIDIWYHICFDPWYHSQPPRPPLPFDHVRWQIRWHSNDFNVSIPSCTGELGRGKERSLAELRSWLEPWGLGASLAELGRGEERSLAEARSGGDGGEWRWQRILLVMVGHIAVLSPLPPDSTSTNKAWCCESLARLRRWHMWILFFLLPWASFLLHGMRLKDDSYENHLMSQIIAEAE